jgi:hypothetical protein
MTWYRRNLWLQGLSVRWKGKCRILTNGSIPKFFLFLVEELVKIRSYVFPSFNNKKRKVFDKRFKGYAR